MPRTYGAPEKIQPQKLADYLAVMSKAVFQTGMSWQVVEKKWPQILEAMRGFEPLAVASLTEVELEQLSRDPRVIRNRRKLEAIVDNARQMVELDEQHAGFRNYLRSHGGFEGTVGDLRKRFRFLGELGCYYFLWVVDEQVPEYDDWCASRGIEHRHD
ncbi:MAG: DNA-3-methyladenine glycosylase I [Dehalococcoidia bacterium]|nr:DNA-3-methyladenine glycosylase I [Dehalococcoidia bacterium]